MRLLTQLDDNKQNPLTEHHQGSDDSILQQLEDMLCRPEEGILLFRD